MFARSMIDVTVGAPRRAWTDAALALSLTAAVAAACSPTPGAPTETICLPGAPCGNTSDVGLPGDGIQTGATSDAADAGQADTSGTDDAVPGTDAGSGDGIVVKTDTVTVGPVAKFVGYPSNELRIRIVGPTGRGHAVVSGAIVEVAGVLFGHADEVVWSTESGASGKAHGAPFFQTDPISLVPGDNVVTVTAKNKVESVTDRVVVTYNPAFTFPDRLRAQPRVLKKGKATAVHAVVALGKASNVVKGSVRLFRVDANGNTVTDFGKQNELVDDGNLATNGDEIKGDGLYSKKVTINDAGAGSVLLRASVQVQLGGLTTTAFTDVVQLDVVEDIVAGDCDAAMAALDDAKAAADAAGGGTAGQAAAVDALKKNGAVDQAGAGSTADGGAWVRFKSGLLGAVNLNGANTRGGGGADGSATAAGLDEALSTVQLQSKRALMLDPFAKSLGDNEVTAATKQMTQTACPAYTIEAFKDTTADLHWFRRLYDYGIVALASHGDVQFKGLDAANKTGYGWQHNGSQEVLWTGHAVSCGYFGANGAPQKACGEKSPCGPESECFLNQAGGQGVCIDHLTADLRRGRVILGSDGRYGILPSFIGRHADRSLPRSLLYLGACRSLWNGTFAGELIAAGAATVLGYNGTVSNSFATKWGTTFFANLIDQKQLSGVAHVQIADPEHPTTSFSLVGAGNLDAAYSAILNQSWESGDLQGWIRNGDGRVVSKFGSALPVAGKFMGIISTGLGYTQQTGEVKQKFCIPPGKTKFSMWWKYYSAEFEEFCGSQYQDQFLAKFEAVIGGKAANKTVVDAKIDNLCKNGNQYKGLTPADLNFDQPGVFMTPWVNSTVDISPFAGNGNVTLRFFTTDAGDGIYDTAIVVDNLEFE